MNRRGALYKCGAALVGAVAGCLDLERGESPPSTRPLEPSTTATATPSSEDRFPVRWEASLGSPTTRPTVDGATAYVGTESGSVTALATDDGDRRWQVQFDDPVVGRPLVASGAVYVVTGEVWSSHRLYALDEAGGDRLWEFEGNSWRLDLLGLANGLLYAATSNDVAAPDGETLYALDVDSGTVEWSGAVGNGGRGLVTDGSVYVPSSGRLYAYDAVDGAQRWTTDLSRYSALTIGATPETVYYAERGGNRGSLVGHDAETGEVRWTFEDWTVTSTTLHDGVLFAGGERIAAFDPERGEQIWERERSGFVPRAPVRDGTLYGGASSLDAYDVANGSRHWSWTPDPTVAGVIPAAATDRTVYVDTFRDEEPRNRYAFAVDAGEGATRWVFDGETELTPVTLGDRGVFVGGADGSVYALASE